MKTKLIELVNFIQSEIRKDNPDLINIDVWCYKLERKINAINFEALSESQSVSDNEDKRKNCRGYDKECNERFKDGFDCRNCFYY